MPKHPMSVPGFTGTNEELGKQMANLHYDAIVEILSAFSSETRDAAIKDGDAGRMHLATALKSSVVALERAKDCFAQAAEISKPFMQERVPS